MTATPFAHVESPPVSVTAPPRPRWQRVLLGRTEDPTWVRPTLVALLVGTGVLYLVGLSATGWANSFYAAAVEAGTKSWKAMFFGSFDSSNFITVDKPPASLWVMEISGRIFGFNTWSMLVPQALEGVAAVGLVYATVRRRFGAGAGLIAGLVLATTPVATLMFRFNNPDALLVLLLVAAAYAVTRALEDTRTRWLVLAGVLIGFGFITKMGQALLVVPGFGVVYLVYARTSLRRRVLQLLAGLAGIIAGAGWWVAAVTLTPAADRPYVGGSSTNSILQLAFGYNGFGRLTGNETGSAGGGGAAGSMWGKTGLTRLFNADFGGQISWLLPAALILAVASYVALRHAGREDGRRAQVGIWASWLLVTGLVISLSKGIIHPYYTVALAPAVGALVGIGVVLLWRDRADWWARITLSATLLATAIWSHHLLNRTPTWHPWIRNVVIVFGILAALAVLVPPRMLGSQSRAVGILIGAVAMLAALAGPLGYSVNTAATAHTGALPSAGPAVVGFAGPGGGFGQRGGGFGPTGGGFGAGPAGSGQGMAIRPPGFGGSSTGATGATGVIGGGPGGGPGGAGGLLNAGTVSSALTAALKANASSYTWVLATTGAENASGYQLAAGEPVMAIGGFNGTDNAPTLAQFENYVREGKIHYYLASGGMTGEFGGSQGGSSSASEIQSWVEQHFSTTTVAGTTLYDLTSRT
ncbi:MAG TPA: glycosyltransferase family 39 protein [Mycobacteriales bacterium]|nr:glycosyltransferase family 39 protein [Mycobacteriales bacterium]